VLPADPHTGQRRHCLPARPGRGHSLAALPTALANAVELLRLDGLQARPGQDGAADAAQMNSGRSLALAGYGLSAGSLRTGPYVRGAMRVGPNSEPH